MEGQQVGQQGSDSDELVFVLSYPWNKGETS